MRPRSLLERDGKMWVEPPIREYDPGTGTLVMSEAFGWPGMERVPSSPALRRGTTPAMTYFSLLQMRAMGIAYGAPPSAGGLAKVKLSTIQNIETIAHLHWLQQRYPGVAPSELIPHTHSYQYAETILTQAGYRIRGVKVSPGMRLPIGQLTAHYERTDVAQRLFGQTAAQRAEVHKEILARYGFDAKAPMEMNFDIVLEVEPL